MKKNGPIFTFYQELIRLEKNFLSFPKVITEPAYHESNKVYAFERLLNGEQLLVLNNFFPEEVEIELLDDYAQGTYPD